jgi:hypothetical protein
MDCFPQESDSKTHDRQYFGRCRHAYLLIGSSVNFLSVKAAAATQAQTTATDSGLVPSVSPGAESKQIVLKRLQDKLAELGENAGAASQQLGRKLGALPMADILKPESLVDAKGIARSRTTLRSTDELIREFDREVRFTLTQTESAVRTSGLPPEDLASATARMNEVAMKAEKLISDLDGQRAGLPTRRRKYWTCVSAVSDSVQAKTARSCSGRRPSWISIESS